MACGVNRARIAIVDASPLCKRGPTPRSGGGGICSSRPHHPSCHPERTRGTCFAAPPTCIARQRVQQTPPPMPLWEARQGRLKHQRGRCACLAPVDPAGPPTKKAGQPSQLWKRGPRRTAVTGGFGPSPDPAGAGRSGVPFDGSKAYVKKWVSLLVLLFVLVLLWTAWSWYQAACQQSV
jgi:hypothetical protein